MTADDGTVSLYAAVLTSATAQNVTALISAPSPQLGTLSPAIVQSEITFKENGTRGLYTLYVADATLPLGANVRQTTLDLTVHGPEARVYRDVFRRIAP